MNQKTLYFFPSLIVGVFLSCLSLYAVPPIIEEILDAESPQRTRLSIKGTTQAQGFSIQIRTVEERDITLPDRKTPGPVSLARMDEEDMKYDLPSLYAAGKTIKTHYETALSYGLWKQRLEARPHYEFTVLYVLEEISEPASPTFMGCVIFSHESPTQLKFFPHIIKPYQGRGIMKELGKYFLQEFIPEIRAHPLTRTKALCYQTLLFKLYSYKEHPRLHDITKALERLSDQVHIPISHPTRFQWGLDLSLLSKKEPLRPLKASKSPPKRKKAASSSLLQKLEDTPKMTSTKSPNIPQNISPLNPPSVLKISQKRRNSARF
ncbi:MAG: hypothetical protein B7Y25_06725 [Alphaproteobacteria bacterium 16-39-46]|nr:MAG: hypothetical protein B7Y25_06725 [Alphaproteobacteria bacterium 16-39-46]OZA42227.1 MAG: hypothetical protein B7X84_06800 [Alphaproteobacteria bacterium 17-39-52]HQS84578.1 hypothetical protein [Alphaproteobacteria bacterium]HQS94367.1 hypothetical protein [Alphaproteobacteria bacterium]